MSAQATTIGIARNMVNHTKARYVAESGLRLAIAYVQSNEDWRTDQSHGTWVTDQAFGGGTFTIVGEDGWDADGDGSVDGDGDLSDDSDDLLTLTVTGRVNGTAHIARAVVTPEGGGGPNSQLTLRPNGIGSLNELGGSGCAAGNWQCTDDVTPDDDSTYVVSSGGSSFEEDSYAVEDSGAASGTISDVTVYMRVRKGDGGSKARTILLTNGSTYLGSQINLNSSTYSDHSTSYATNLFTGSAWTWAEIDALEIGVTTRKAAPCTQVHVVISYVDGGGGGYAVAWRQVP